jgi:hypothetical protein
MNVTTDEHCDRPVFAPLRLCGNFVFAQSAGINCFTEEDSHFSKVRIVLGFRQALLSMSEDGDRLLKCDARKPFEKLINRCSRFQVFKQSLYRDASAAKNPRATNLSFLPLNFRTTTPI